MEELLGRLLRTPDGAGIIYRVEVHPYAEAEAVVVHFDEWRGFRHRPKAVALSEEEAEALHNGFRVADMEVLH